MSGAGDDDAGTAGEGGAPGVEAFVHDGREVRVSCTHRVDAPDPDANGRYAYYYEYDWYEFTLGTETLRARAYTDEPEEAHFLGITRGRKRGPLAVADLGEPLARAAVAYLRAAGKTKLTWLDPTNRTSGYSAVPDE